MNAGHQRRQARARAVQETDRLASEEPVAHVNQASVPPRGNRGAKKGSKGIEVSEVVV